MHGKARISFLRSDVQLLDIIHTIPRHHALCHNCMAFSCESSCFAQLISHRHTLTHAATLTTWMIIKHRHYGMNYDYIRDWCRWYKCNVSTKNNSVMEARDHGQTWQMAMGTESSACTKWKSTQSEHRLWVLYIGTITESSSKRERQREWLSNHSCVCSMYVHGTSGYSHLAGGKAKYHKDLLYCKFIYVKCLSELRWRRALMLIYTHGNALHRCVFRIANLSNMPPYIVYSSICIVNTQCVECLLQFSLQLFSIQPLLSTASPLSLCVRCIM